MAVETFGVTSTLILSYVPQIDVAATAPITTARIDEIIEGNAARLGGYLLAAYGEGIEATIAADATSTPYRNCQRVIVDLCLPEVVLAAHHLGVVPEGYETLEKRANELLRRVREQTVSEIGYLPSGADAGFAPSGTSTQYLGFQRDATDTPQRTFWGAKQVSGVPMRRPFR